MTSVSMQHNRHAFGNVGAWLQRLPSWFVGFMATMIVVALGGIDYLNGPDMVLSMLYVVPLSAAAWRLRLPYSTALCVLTSFIWETTDILSGARYSTAAIPLWNMTARMGVFLLIVVLLTRLRDALASQTWLASVDSLTQVANPRSFEEAAAEAMVDARRRQRPLSVAYIDLDDFKAVNDTLGHSGGDHVLRVVADALRARTRGTDVVARLGGDEFAVLLPDTASSEAEAMMTGLIARLEHSLQDMAMPVTFSAGVVTFLALPASVDALLQPADALMYDAKAKGKAGYAHATIGAGEPGAYPDVATPRTPVRQSMSA
jgi:diguanylate cyclase (GGDEF)-like protein